jgi:acyl dehydratase
MKADEFFSKISVGDKLPELSVTLDQDSYFDYNRHINNVNPLHSDTKYARAIGFEDIVVAGVYTFSFIPRMIEDWSAGKLRVISMEISYSKPAYINRTIVHKAEVSDKSDNEIMIEVRVENEDKLLLTSATLKASSISGDA